MSVRRLWFGPHDPVRAASAVTGFGDGWLIAQDDATAAAWWRPGTGQVRRLRLLPPREGLDEFDEASGTKHLKPDLEASCPVQVGGRAAALLLGSGSLPARTDAVVVTEVGGAVAVRTADLAALHARVRDALGLAEGQLNLEGACVVGDRLRWYQRGLGRAGVPSASVDLDLAALLAVIQGHAEPAGVGIGGVRRYALGELDGLPLAITDAVALPDGRICASATAEDAPDAVADGPVAGSALALLDGEAVTVAGLPDDLAGMKVEGLAVVGAVPDGARLLVVVDDDDPAAASAAIELILTWEVKP